jgi:hypothetical protein
MCVGVPGPVTVSMMPEAKMRVAMLMCRFRRITRLDSPPVDVRVHSQRVFYAFELRRAAMLRPYYAV